jgi:stage III sporulation protein AA
MELMGTGTKEKLNSYHPVFSVLPGNLRELVAGLPLQFMDRLEEIRLRQNRPLIVTHTAGDIYLSPAGEPTRHPGNAYIVSGDDIQRVTRMVSNSSLYAIEEELKNGYITLPGGHRVGITGKAVLEAGKVKTIKYISGFNIRVSREVKGIADNILPYLLDKDGRVKHCLIISPPRCGKTTLLRDLVRLISNGKPELNYTGVNVGLVDERSELAGCYRGVPQRDIGLRTDVLDACPKAEGMMMLLRAMAPQVIATDEIGKVEDIKAMEEVVNAGVTVLSTVHGSSPEEIMRRPALKYLLGLNVIEKFIILGRSRGVGTVEDIADGTGFLFGGVDK